MFYSPGTYSAPANTHRPYHKPVYPIPARPVGIRKTIAGFVIVSHVNFVFPQLTLEVDCSADEYFTKDIRVIKSLLYWLHPAERIPLEKMNIPSGSEVILDVVGTAIIGFR